VGLYTRVCGIISRAYTEGLHYGISRKGRNDFFFASWYQVFASCKAVGLIFEAAVEFVWEINVGRLFALNRLF
jgi:hypothetical protein